MSQEAVRNSIDWLRTQSHEVALSCLEKLKHAADPMDELCSIALTEQNRRLPMWIPPQEAMLAMSTSLNSMLDVELSLAHPGSFPLLFDGPPDFPVSTSFDSSTVFASQ